MKTFFLASILVGSASASASGLRGQVALSDLLAARGQGQLKSSSFVSAVAAKAAANPDKVVEEIEKAIEEAERHPIACSFQCTPGYRIVPGSLNSNGCKGRCEPIVCNRDVRQCPGSDPFNPVTVSRNPALDCAFDRCPEPKPCTREVKPCPGTATSANPFGVSVGRDPLNDCEFKKCPEVKACTREVKPCPGTATSANPLGVSVGRDPLNDCEFEKCPLPAVRFEKVGDGFCRTRHNGKGKANFEPGNDNDYQTLPHISLEECREVCASETPTSSAGEQGYVCKGYEYNHKARKCEIWYTEPAKVARKRGAVCFRAKHAK